MIPVYHFGREVCEMMVRLHSYFGPKKLSSSPRTRSKLIESRLEIILLSCISPNKIVQIQALHNMNKKIRYIYRHLP